MAEATQQGGIGKYLVYAPLVIPSIGIPVLFGFVAFKAVGLAFDAAGFAFGLVRKILPGGAAVPAQPAK
ncbi:MAG: hypothetical protein HGB19_08170 [Chlorobiales bacterium]|jgi:hypothetical protein|nr:hypothetical protein [Chlorobiales bacterium]